MKILTTNLLLLTAAMMLTLSTSAQAQRRGGVNQGQMQQQVAKRIQRYMNTGDRINVSRAFQGLIGHRQKVTSLRVVAQSTYRNSRIVLKSNGHRIAAVNIGMYSSSQMLRVPSHVNLSSLTLVVQGSAFVQRVVAQTRRTNHGQAQLQTVKAQVNILTTRAGAVLPVKQLVKQQSNVQLRNKKIVAVVVKAKAMMNRNGRANAKVQVLVNGYAVGSPVRLSSVMQNQVINLRGVSTQGASIKLQVIGKAKVQMVGLKVKRRNF